LLLIALRNLQTFCLILFAGSWPELPQHSILNMFVFSLLFCFIVASFSCTVFDPGLPSNPAHRFSIRFLPLTLFVHFILCVSYFDIQILFSVQSLPRPSYFCAQFCPTMATIFCSSWDECPTTLWTVPAFSEPATMTREDLTHPVAAAATTLVKLCPYDEEEPHIWFCLIEACSQQQGSDPKSLSMPML
jgi:hypothetical protein